MSVRTTPWFTVALAMLVGALVVASPFCVLPACASMTPASSAAMPIECTSSTVVHQLHPDCSEMGSKSPVVANVQQPVQFVSDAVASVLVFEAPIRVETLQVSSLDPRPPDPLSDSSRLRL